jgi:outer membrane protein assembly factor BamB
MVRLSLQNSTIYEKFEIGEQDFILALNRADGTKKWQVPIRAANYVPVFFEDTLIFCQFDQWGKPAILTALQSESGNLVWEREFTGTYDYPDLKIIDGQLFFRLVDKDRHTDDILYSVDPKTGALLWTFNNDLRYGKIRYTIQGEHIFIVTSNKLLFSLDRRTGQVAWTSNLEAAPIYLLENQSILLVASEGGQISAFDENTGAKLWGYASNISRSLFIDEEDAGFLFQINSGKLLIADDTAWIQTLDIKTGKQTSGWNHNGRYQWLFKANYGLGPSDGQFLFITGDDGRFSGAGTGFERIFKINLDKLIQP